MELFQTKLSIQDAKRPTELDQLRILCRRKRYVSEDERYQLMRLEAGEAGEETVIQYLREYGCEHWVVLRNVWLSDYGVCECDILLITNHCIYVFEVKNYTGTFTYENGTCLINGRNNKNNCIAQARKAYLNLRDIIQKYARNIKTEGALIFVGIDNMVDIKSPVEDIQVIQRNQLRHFIQKIAEQEQIKAYRPIDKFALIQHLEAQQVSNPYFPKPLTLGEMTEIKKGIYCAHCHSFDVEVGKSQYISCPCGFSEPRDRAIVRTICEYGVLQYDETLKLENLLQFFGDDVTRNKLSQVLHKYFESVNKNKYTYHINKKLPLEKILKEFHFLLPNKLTQSEMEYTYISEGFD